MRVSLYELPAVFQQIGHEITRWKAPLRSFERNDLRRIQQDHALAGWGGRALHKTGAGLSKWAQEGRRERLGYYRFAPHSRASHQTRLLWTGRMMESTATLTELREDGAEVDTARAYRGPLPDADPIETIAIQMHGAEPWPLEQLNRSLDDLAEARAKQITRAVSFGNR